MDPAKFCFLSCGEIDFETEFWGKGLISGWQMIVSIEKGYTRSLKEVSTRNHHRSPPLGHERQVENPFATNDASKPRYVIFVIDNENWPLRSVLQNLLLMATKRPHARLRNVVGVPTGLASKDLRLIGAGTLWSTDGSLNRADRGYFRGSMREIRTSTMGPESPGSSIFTGGE